MEKQIKEQIDAINRYIKLQNNLFQQVAAKIGISNTELYILIFLCRSDEICTQNDIVECWLYPKQTVSFTVNKLSNEGLVCLPPIPGTRNKKAISLTEKGVAFCQNYVAPVIEAEDTAFLALTDNEREMFDFLVNKHYTLLKETMNKLL